MFILGFENNPETVRDLRRHRDLNGMRHRDLIKKAQNSGFQLTHFDIPPLWFSGKVHTPILTNALDFERYLFN